jgi:hypothetical protein
VVLAKMTLRLFIIERDTPKVGTFEASRGRRQAQQGIFAW